MTVINLDTYQPKIADSAYIAEDARVIGRVLLGWRVSVWPGAILRGDVEEIIVNDGTNIQDAAVIHTNYNLPAIIGKDVTVGHGAILHGCQIGDNCLIGMGAIILDGAKIGNNCIVAAGALVPENTVVSDGKVIMGLPAKVIRDITPAEIAKISANARDYERLALIYRRSYARDQK